MTPVIVLSVPTNSSNLYRNYWTNEYTTLLGNPYVCGAKRIFT